MKYLVLRARIFTPGKGNKISLEKSYSETPMRDTVVENLYNVLTISFDKEKKAHVPKSFDTLADHKNFQKFKEKVVVSEADTVELGNDLFEWVKSNYNPEGYGAASSTTVVALSDMLEACEKQDESEAEKEYKAHKDAKPMTVAEYFTSTGAEVVITENKEEAKTE